MNFSYGDLVTLKQRGSIIHGRVLKSYGNYCDVVWDCDEKDWWKYSAQKELKVNLTHGHVAREDNRVILVYKKTHDYICSNCQTQFNWEQGKSCRYGKHEYKTLREKKLIEKMFCSNECYNEFFKTPLP